MICGGENDILMLIHLCTLGLRSTHHQMRCFIFLLRYQMPWWVCTTHLVFFWLSCCCIPGWKDGAVVRCKHASRIARLASLVCLHHADLGTTLPLTASVLWGDESWRRTTPGIHNLNINFTYPKERNREPQGEWFTRDTEKSQPNISSLFQFYMRVIYK